LSWSRGGASRWRGSPLSVKVAGYSYDEIAAQLDVSWLTVNR
jgi:hypothetical protein